jgi:hypothetical protein
MDHIGTEYKYVDWIQLVRNMERRGLLVPKAIVRLEGLGELKNTSSGLDPATFRLVA